MGEQRAVLDHVVIGPAGVFVIDTLYEPDGSVWVVGNTVKVNGDSEPHVHTSRHRAQAVERALSRACGRPVAARGILAVVCDPARFTVKRQPDDVRVVRRSQIPELLASAPTIWNATDTEVTQCLARRSVTWSTTR
jgi:hypothetical protein